MSHYRAPPAVLPSLRALDAPYPGDGDRSLWNEDVDEQIARLRAAAAPCPAFAVGPSDHRWRIPPSTTPLPGPGRSVLA